MINQFKQWLTEEGKAPKTIDSYINDVSQYQKYLDEKSGQQVLLSRFAFVQYKQHLLEIDLANATINKKINSLKVYNNFLQVTKVVEDSYISLKKDRVAIASGSEHHVEVLTEDQIEKLLFHLEQPSVSLRNRLSAYILLYTGVRISELVNIKQKDIDGLTQTLTVRGKGGKVREISLRQDVMRLIQEYRTGERANSRFKESHYLLLSQRAPRMHRDAVRNWLERTSEGMGVKLYPHLFRHTFCTRLLKKGVDLTTVSKIVGHSTVNMTARFYIQTTREEKIAAVELL